MNLRLIQSNDIDKTKWNSCVHFAPNGNVFGYKWYLDQVAKDWVGLVEGDYESVFPLVWRYRRGLWGHKELHQPYWMREMGIYSVHVLSPTRIQEFLEHIPREFRHINIAVSGKNRVPESLPFTTVPQTNFQLSLNDTYETLTGRYASDLFRQMDKASSAKLMLTSNLKPEKIAAFYEQHARDRRDLDARFHALQRIMYNVLHRGWGFTSAVLDGDGNPCAVNFFINSHGKLLSLVPVASKAGEQVGALSFMFDLTLRIHAERALLLDFNGYERAVDFGAEPTHYFLLNRAKEKSFF
ncbi:MAG: hypothetical protein HUU01_07410 [Saprospiraceae bacterium]|nr:hypothetical protein [Saprospiraceae bacterium]